MIQSGLMTYVPVPPIFFTSIYVVYIVGVIKLSLMYLIFAKRKNDPQVVKKREVVPIFRV